jgi:hypothetical protein
MEILYLTSHNLHTLLSKLRRYEAGEETQCSIIKSDTSHPEYPSTAEVCVIAIADKDYYKDRRPGAVHPADA